jgi:hypothetical protein
MTIATTTNKKQYTANGTNDTFAYDFLILDKAHLYVYVDGAIQTEGASSDYTVTGVGGASGGNVVFNTTRIPAADAIVTLLRIVSMTQEVDYVENDKFPANTHEQALDKLTMLVQQLEEQYSRAIILTLLSEYDDLTMPDPVAGYFLQWKDDLSGLQNALALDASEVSISAFMETLLDDADGEAGLVTLGIRSADLIIDNGGGTSIRCQMAGSASFNGDDIAQQDNIVKGATTGHFTLSADGAQLTIEASGLSGNCTGFFIAAISYNTSATDLTVKGIHLNNDIVLSFQAAPAAGVGVSTDLTARVDENGGAAMIRVQLVYFVDG